MSIISVFTYIFFKVKCAILSFSLKKYILIFDYAIDNKSLSRKDVVNDLGVIFNSKLSFKYHVNVIKSKWF